MNLRARLVFALLLQTVVVSLAQAALNPDETRIVAAVDAAQDEAVALLETVVNINSGTMNFEGVRQVGQVFERGEDMGTVTITRAVGSQASLDSAVHRLRQVRMAAFRTARSGQTDDPVLYRPVFRCYGSGRT